MPPRMTQESCRPRVSDRTMVGNTATRLACEFQRTKRRRHVSEHETTGTKKHPRSVAPRPSGPLRNGAKRSSRCRTNVATGAGGWMSKKYSCRSGGEKCFLLDIPFNRTSRSCGFGSGLPTRSAMDHRHFACDKFRDNPGTSWASVIPIGICNSGQGAFSAPHCRRPESHNQRIGIPAGCWNAPNIVRP